MSRYLGTPKVQYFKTNTVEYLSGGKLYSYIAGTDTPLATYPTITDATAGTNANTNPVILDARGEASVVLSGATKLILKDSADNVIWTEDNVEQSSQTILDENGNELLKFSSVTSAVNELTITNASVGNPPSLIATGGDTDISFTVSSKGGGTLNLDGGSTGAVYISSGSNGGMVVTGTSTLTGNLGVTGSSTLAGAVEVGSTLSVSDNVTFGVTKSFNIVPVATVLWRASTSVPSGWLECNGTDVSRTTYASLFAEIGTTYGSGDGSTTFTLPSQARRVIMGKGGSGTATISNTVGSYGGAETVTLIDANMPSNVPTSSSGITSLGTDAPSGSNYVPRSTGWAGGSDTATNIVQPALVMMMIIRAY